MVAFPTGVSPYISRVDSLSFVTSKASVAEEFATLTAAGFAVDRIGVLGPDGARVEVGEEPNPSPRDMDPMPWRVEDGQLMVRYRRFRTGVAERAPV